MTYGPLPPDGERRTGPDRRAIPRGGRRRHERDRSDRDTIIDLVVENAALREENALLRRAALAFGALAERLNTTVRAGRK